MRCFLHCNFQSKFTHTHSKFNFSHLFEYPFESSSHRRNFSGDTPTVEKITKMTPEKKKPLKIENLNPNEFSNRNPYEEKGNCSSMVKRRRVRVTEEARNSVPENGKVMHLVKAFERLLSIKREKEKNEDEEENEKKNKVMKWALPGLQFQQPVMDEDEQSEVVSGCRDDDGSLFNCTLQLGLDQRVSVTCSWDCGSRRRFLCFTSFTLITLKFVLFYLNLIWFILLEIVDLCLLFLCSVCSGNSSGGKRSRRNVRFLDDVIVIVFPFVI